jgi:endonuclease G
MYHCYGWTAVYDSFLLSNASPQLKSFNGGIWKHLETLVRNDYSSSLGEVWVITGPIFDDSNGQQYLSKDVDHACCQQKLVEIPDAFYKIIIAELEGEVRALAFIIKHFEDYGYSQGGSTVERLSGLLFSIDEIEEATGLDFLSELDDTLEDDLEREPATMWRESK